jgi:sulfonate transport system permease protein
LDFALHSAGGVAGLVIRRHSGQQSPAFTRCSADCGYINTVHGIRSIDPRLLEMGRSYGLSRFGLFLNVILPGALPSILVGLRYALGIMWLTLIVAETIACDNGIGYMTMNARDFLQTDIVLLGICLYALLGKAADMVTRLLERRLLRWHPAHSAS